MVEEPRSGTASNQCLLEGFFHQRSFQGRADGPTNNSATVEVHDCGQVHPTGDGPEVSDIGHPSLIGPIGSRSLLQEIGSSAAAAGTLSGAGPERSFLPCAHRVKPHQTGYPLFIAMDVLLAQVPGQPGAAISLTAAFKGRFHMLKQVAVELITSAGPARAPAVKATTRHLQGQTQVPNGKVRR